MQVSRLWLLYLQYIAVGASALTNTQRPLAHVLATGFPDFAFAPDWQVLGPFQIGTRGIELHGLDIIHTVPTSCCSDA